MGLTGAEAEASGKQVRRRERAVVPESGTAIRQLRPHHSLHMATRPSLTVSPKRSPVREQRSEQVRLTGAEAEASRTQERLHDHAVVAESCTAIRQLRPHRPLHMATRPSLTVSPKWSLGWERTRAAVRAGAFDR